METSLSASPAMTRTPQVRSTETCSLILVYFCQLLGPVSEEMSIPQLHSQHPPPSAGALPLQHGFSGKEEETCVSI